MVAVCVCVLVPSFFCHSLFLFLLLRSRQLCCAFNHSLLIVRFYDVLWLRCSLFPSQIQEASYSMTMSKQNTHTPLNSNSMNALPKSWYWRLFSQVKFSQNTKANKYERPKRSEKHESQDENKRSTRNVHIDRRCGTEGESKQLG